MKKTIITLFFAVIIISSSFQPVKGGFRTDNLSLGGGISYRLGVREDFRHAGIHIESYYSFTRHISAGLDGTYHLLFSPYSAYDINMNAMFLPNPDDDWRFNALVGIQYISIEYYWGDGDIEDKYGLATALDHHSGFGFNLGTNIEYGHDDFRMFTQPKITLYCLDKFRMTPNIKLGVRFFLN